MSRGKPKVTLRNLSKGVDIDLHINDTLDEIKTQSDRGAALIAAALADECLKRAMLCRMREIPDFTEVIYEKEGAPLGTFSSRIKMARALGTIGPKAEAHLNVIRNIRNQFAHSVIKLDFTHELLTAECEKLRGPGLDDREVGFQRRLYIGTVVALCIALEHEFQRLKDNQIPTGLD